MIYVGIDPGLNGSISIIKNNNLSLVPMPTIKLDKKEIDMPALSDFLKVYVAQGKSFCVLEKAQAMPGQGVSSMFKIGKGYGILLALLSCLEIPFQEVHPRVWTKEMFRGVSGEGKDRSFSVARKLFPSWKPKYKYEKEYADSILMAEYARRIHGSNTS